MCTPVNEMLCKNNLFTRRINALLSIIFVNVMIFIFIFMVGNLLVSKISLFMSNDLLNIECALNKISYAIGISFEGLKSKINTYYLNIMNSGLLERGAAYTTDGLFAYFIGNITAYFILSDKYAILNWTQVFISKEKVLIIKEKFEFIKKMLKIEVMLVALTTIETMAGFLILGVQNAVVFALICGILDILPYVGSVLVFLPMIVYRIVIKQYFTAFGLIFLYILLITIRQILEAKFMSKKLGIHPLSIILSIYVGITIFGVIGLIVAPIYVITAKEILNS